VVHPELKDPTEDL
jgi:hypothetical protein